MWLCIVLCTLALESQLDGIITAAAAAAAAATSGTTAIAADDSDMPLTFLGAREDLISNAADMEVNFQLEITRSLASLDRAQSTQH